MSDIHIFVIGIVLAAIGICGWLFGTIIGHTWIIVIMSGLMAIGFAMAVIALTSSTRK